MSLVRCSLLDILQLQQRNAKARFLDYNYYTVVLCVPWQRLISMLTVICHLASTSSMYMHLAPRDIAI